MLLPALAVFIGLTLYALWRKKQYDAYCHRDSPVSRNSTHE
ncbi:MAG: mercury resistance system transport protein MerF [Halomonas sp.]|nr:mercury resistance system transport protein MerF [Halomonas sp.]